MIVLLLELLLEVGAFLMDIAPGGSQRRAARRARRARRRRR